MTTPALSPEMAKRLASLTPAQRELFERALKKKEAQPAPTPSAKSSSAVIPRRTGEGPWPLSLDQERFWRNQRRNPESPVYNIVGANRFRGRLDVAAFARALNEVVRRHESLRTTFHEIDGRPVQKVAPEYLMPLPVIDLRALPHHCREAEAERAIFRVLREPFDLERLPLLRMFLVQVEEDDFIRPFSIHHGVNDHLSVWNMEADLIDSYAAFAAGRQPELPPPPFQQADFAVWQREKLSDQALVAERMSWWRERLDGFPDPLDFPFDRPRPSKQRPWGERRPLEISRTRSEGLRSLAQREGVTLFMAGLAVFDTLLVRLTGQEKLIVGTPMTYSEALVDGLLGFYLNQVPLPVDLSGNPPFREALRRVRDSVLGAHAHNDLPLQLLVEELRGEPDPSFFPFTQFTFLLLDPPKIVGAEVPGLHPKRYPVDGKRTQYDTQLALFWEEGVGLNGMWEYNTDLFHRTTADRFKEHFRVLLGSVLADPDTPILDLSLLTEGERQTLREWSDAAGVHLLDRRGGPVPIGVFGEVHVADGEGRLTATGERARWLWNGSIEKVSRS